MLQYDLPWVRLSPLILLSLPFPFVSPSLHLCQHLCVNCLCYTQLPLPSLSLKNAYCRCHSFPQMSLFIRNQARNSSENHFTLTHLHSLHSEGTPLHSPQEEKLSHSDSCLEVELMFSSDSGDFFFSPQSIQVFSPHTELLVSHSSAPPLVCIGSVETAGAHTSRSLCIIIYNWALICGSICFSPNFYLEKLLNMERS